MSKKVLLSGGTGFIGRHLITLLDASNEIEIVKVCRNINKQLEAEGFQGIDNICHNTNWVPFLQNTDVIVHLAGLAHDTSANHYSDTQYNDINVNGTMNLARQAAENGVRRFVFLSSIGVNGSITHGTPFNEMSTPSPQNSYTESKLEAENELFSLAKETDMEIVIIRPPLVYGGEAPGNLNKLVKMVKKFPFLPFGLINNKRSFISVWGLIDCISKCISQPAAAGQLFVVADQLPISIKDFTNSLATSLGKKTFQLPIPKWCFKLAGIVFNKKQMVSQLVDDLEVDPTKANRLLNWVSKSAVENLNTHKQKS